MKFIAIVGSRNYAFPQRVYDFLNQLAQKYEEAVIVSGGARGVDSWAEEKARQLCLATLVFPANWERFGKRAGFLRNTQIVQASEIVVGFWDGQSAGTLHTLTTASRAGKQVFVAIGNGPVKPFDPKDMETL